MMFGTLTKIVSGAQTGADRGALNAARALALPIGGWAPQGWRAEDGCIPLELRQYMRESVSPNYGLRTRLNVQDSDGTLILSFADRLTGGSKFTVDQVKAQRKPCKHLVLPRGSGIVPGEVTAALWDWIDEHRIAVLNVAGPRESKERGIQAAVERVIRDLLRAKHRSTIMAAMAFGDANADAQTAAQKKLFPEDMADRVFQSAFANHGEGIKEAYKTGALRMMCPDCGSREPCICAFNALWVREVTAANEAMDRKEREVYGSGKYREAGADGVNVIGLRPFLELEIDIPPVHGAAHLIVDHAAIEALEADIARISTEIAENLASAPLLFSPGSRAREFIEAVDARCAALLEPASMPDFAPTHQDGAQVAPPRAACSCAREEGDAELHAEQCPAWNQPSVTHWAPVGTPLSEPQCGYGAGLVTLVEWKVDA